MLNKINEFSLLMMNLLCMCRLGPMGTGFAKSVVIQEASIWAIFNLCLRFFGFIQLIVVMDYLVCCLCKLIGSFSCYLYSLTKYFFKRYLFIYIKHLFPPFFSYFSCFFILM